MKRALKDVFNKINKDTQEQNIRTILAPKESIKKQVFLRCLAKAANRKIARLANDGSYTIYVTDDII
jgi:hypothetical protein